MYSALHECMLVTSASGDYAVTVCCSWLEIKCLLTTSSQWAIRVLRQHNGVSTTAATSGGSRQQGCG
jgi:hypothetical protein